MFDLPILLQIGWTSLATSSCYVLFALAFALTLKVAQVWNFVQAGVMGLAFYAMYAAMLRWEWPHWAGFLLGLAVAVAASVAGEAWGYRVLRRRRSHGLLMFIFAIVVAEFVAYLLSLVFGTDSTSHATSSRSGDGASVTTMMRPPRDSTSFRFESDFWKSASCGISTTTGSSSLMSAIGPCFISPAG